MAAGPRPYAAYDAFPLVWTGQNEEHGAMLFRTNKHWAWGGADDFFHAEGMWETSQLYCIDHLVILLSRCVRSTDNPNSTQKS